MQPTYRLMAFATAISLGAAISAHSTYQHEPAGSKGDIVIVANETQSGSKDTQDSAKMGKDEGTHTGSSQAVNPESDTQKIEQSGRKNNPGDNPGTSSQ